MDKKGREDWFDLGVGDIVVDSAADESCWPKGAGDAFPTRRSSKNILLKTANGSEMNHYGEKEITFEHGDRGGVVGMVFQVTDVTKPLLSVRRLVERGSKVVFSGEEGESYISHQATGVNVPLVKKGGAWVIEARSVTSGLSGFARPA